MSKGCPGNICGFFLLVIATVVLWFVFDATILVTRYLSSSSSSPVEKIEWSVREIKSNKFAVHAKYTFKVDDKVYESQTIFGKVFENPLNAEDSKVKKAAKDWVVWYNENKIHRSTLEKVFPWKKCIYAAILTALLIYFIQCAVKVRSFMAEM